MTTFRTATMDVLLPDLYAPRSASPARVQFIHLSAEAWDNLAVLTPEEHAELPTASGWDTTIPATLQEELATVATTDDPPGLCHFLTLIDRADMGHSIDLALWLRAWRTV